MTQMTPRSTRLQQRYLEKKFFPAYASILEEFYSINYGILFENAQIKIFCRFYLLKF